MPNAKGGKKFKKGKKQTFHQKALIYKDPKEDQEYGKVIRAMGNGRFEIQCFDGKVRMGIIAGNMRKRVWVNKDDIIFVGDTLETDIKLAKEAFFKSILVLSGNTKRENLKKSHITPDITIDSVDDLSTVIGSI